MKREAGLIITALIMAGSIGFSIFTLPLRGSEPMPESGIKTEPCTLDLEVARIEEEIESRKAVLDAMLETAELVKEAKVVTEATETDQVTTGAPESESVEESTTEEETSESEPQTEPQTEPYTIFPLTDSMMPADLQAWTYAHCTEVGVDPYIVIAICERESCCIPDIMGDGGDSYGMMQIQIKWIPDKLAAHGYTADDMLRAQPNIEIGTEILKDYLDTGKGIEWALMAYNGGANSAGTESTRSYAAWVMARAEELRKGAQKWTETR